jgi:ABC-type ATPase with predicted acetyltransferase domain
MTDSKTNLTTIQVTAATPAVLETLCNRITDEVMKLIPDDTVARIAQEVLNHGIAVQKVSAWGDKQRYTVHLANMAEERLEGLMRTKCGKVLDELWSKPEVAKEVEALIQEHFIAAMGLLPRMVSAILVERLAIKASSQDWTHELASFCVAETRKLREAIQNVNIPVQTVDAVPCPPFHQ